jgi:hypothetical protein
LAIGRLQSHRHTAIGTKSCRMIDNNDDRLDIPEFLKISQEQRKQAWTEYDARKATPASNSRVISETERLYRESIERGRAIAKYYRDRARYAFFEKKRSEQAEIDAVKKAAREAHQRAPRHP